VTSSHRHVAGPCQWLLDGDNGDCEDVDLEGLEGFGCLWHQHTE